ncbi:MAG: hypothetical protein KC415_09770 [Anaerolineales bacterium]|nr:hypothetical protein [Anaerolineales bacterium]
MIRLWRNGRSATWHASLQNPHTGEQHRFPDLPSLLAFLETQTNERWAVSRPHTSIEKEDI